MHRGTVYNIYSYPQQQEAMPISGHSQELDSYSYRDMLRNVQYGHAIARQRQDKAVIPISVIRARKMFISADPYLHYTLMTLVPLLTSIHKTCHVEWANTHECWTIEQWHTLVCSDEKYFY